MNETREAHLEVGLRGLEVLGVDAAVLLDELVRVDEVGGGGRRFGDFAERHLEAGRGFGQLVLLGGGRLEVGAVAAVQTLLQRLVLVGLAFQAQQFQLVGVHGRLGQLVRGAHLVPSTPAKNFHYSPFDCNASFVYNILVAVVIN